MSKLRVGLGGTESKINNTTAAVCHAFGVENMQSL